MRRQYFLLILILLTINGVSAQDQQLTFTNLSEKDGLRNKIIFSFLKDSHGILWIGTQNGLNRFDGSHFYSYKKTRDTNSLPNNTINCLSEDRKGNIWGGTVNGIFRYSPAENKFTTFYAPAEAFDNIVSNIQCDSRGDIFAATSVALLKFDHQQQQFRMLARITDSRDSLSWYSLGKNRVLLDEKNDGLWIATRSGLLCYDIRKQKLLGQQNNPGSPLFESRSTAALARSSGGRFWFFDNSSKTFIQFDPSSKTITRQINISREVPDARGATILEDSQQRLWFSSWSYDLVTIDLAHQDKIWIIQSIEGKSQTVASNFFWAALEDENQTVWLGTLNGISMCNPGKYLYKACRLPGKIPELKESAIYIIEENPEDKTWWIVTRSWQIIHYFPESGKYEIFKPANARPNARGALPYNINKLHFIDHSLVITSAEGAWELKPGQSTIIPWTKPPPEYGDLAVVNIMAADSLLYLTDGNRMMQWNPKTGKTGWIQNRKVPDTGTKFGFGHLMWKPGHQLYWTLSGNYIFTASTDLEAKPIQLVKDTKLEAGGYFHSADMDNEGNVWVNNKGVGLYRYAPKTGEIRYWNELDGLADNHIHGLRADNNGIIWTLYFNQVSVFNPAKNSFINFSIPYSENNLNYFNWTTRRSDGVIMGSIANDAFEFFGDNLNRVPVQKTPELSVINISGRDYFNTAGGVIKLDPDQHSIRFKFGLLADPSLYPHEFEYMLEGSDKDWVQSSPGNEAVYNNLPPGSYTFRVIAKGRNNAWQSFEKTIRIRIRTPFYKSTVFLVCSGTLIAAILFWLYQYRLRQQRQIFQLKSKAQLLEKEKTAVMYESLKQQLNPHFLFNSLSSLSGLINTNQELAGSFLEQMSGIYRYILKNGDKETVTIKSEIEFVKLYISLQQTRFRKGLQVNIDVPDEYLHYKIAPVTLQNLIENAIKHNIIDSESPLVIRVYTENDYLVVSNNLQKKNMVETSNKKGLAQFETLYRYLSDKPIVIGETATHFTIRIPLI